MLNLIGMTDITFRHPTTGENSILKSLMPNLSITLANVHVRYQGVTKSDSKTYLRKTTARNIRKVMVLVVISYIKRYHVQRSVIWICLITTGKHVMFWDKMSSHWVNAYNTRQHSEVNKWEGSTQFKLRNDALSTPNNQNMSRPKDQYKEGTCTNVVNGWQHKLNVGASSFQTPPIQ